MHGERAGEEARSTGGAKVRKTSGALEKPNPALFVFLEDVIIDEQRWRKYSHSVLSSCNSTDTCVKKKTTGKSLQSTDSTPLLKGKEGRVCQCAFELQTRICIC